MREQRQTPIQRDAASTLQPLTNRVAFDEADGAAVGGGDGAVEWKAQFRVNRCCHVISGVLVPRGTLALFVGGAQDGATRNSHSGHDDEPGAGPVVAAAG